ncbi:MAG: hypothetical protein ACR2MG_06890 [Pyrinomonadaceae bacterium]
MNKIYKIKENQKKSAFVCGYLWFISCFLSFSISAQDLPDKIRGYKIYQAKVSVKNQNEKTSKPVKTDVKDNVEAFVKVSEPEVLDVSLTGVTLTLSAEVDALEQSGTVDFLTFKDFRVNGLTVEVEEYKESFVIRKNQPITLPKPVKIFIGIRQTLRGALNEFKDSKNEWTVTGTVFVFGHFKKSFLNFKRVVPVEVNLKIKNPLQTTSQHP